MPSLLAPYRDALRGLDPRIRALVTGTFLFIAGRGSLLTFLGIFFHELQGLPITLVGVAFLVENLSRALMAPVAGALSDRIGRRAVLLGTAASSAIVLPFFLMVDTPATLVIWSAVFGACQGGWFPTSLGLILDLAPRARRQSALALNYTALALGFTLGVAPAGFVAQLGYGWLALGGSTVLALVLVVLLRSLKGPLPMDERHAAPASLLADTIRPFRDAAFLGPVSLFAIFPLALGLITLAVPVYAKGAGVPEGTIGLLLGVNGVLLAFLALPINVRIERTGPYRHLPLAALLSMVAFVALALSPAPASILVAMAAFTVGEAIFSSALPAAVEGVAPRGARGAYQGAWGMVFAAAAGGSLYFAGLVRDAAGWPAAWLAFAGLAYVVALALAWRRGRFAARAQERSGDGAAT